ncbi:uncharacterized protein LOC133843779 [Drosophila sulfurigaster albostrigata]|uniref:uncharacterized protein LOC133843779 n=1 Tax=Drosophila sulfurigaster albostrigata TaxID=89887 RepID=UPI002D21ECBD|nr:uncharacterized protein LOC133843779 [Drosophila sulfurigaster albostrigata]
MEFEKHVGFSKHAVVPKIELAYQAMQKKNKKSHSKKSFKNSTKRQPQKCPSSQVIWRKTIVLTKVKHKANLPRIFTPDRITGLPLDYERTVSKIMHYVNPQASNSSSPDQLIEEFLTQTLVGYLKNYTCCDQSSLKKHMRMILQIQGPNVAQSYHRNDEELFEFHCACKRKPIPPVNIVPTYGSKFNYNNLKIKSK